ncbi:zinc ribbon domain-containing protein [Oscillospiraceae bacterium 50-58]
MPFCTHCGQQVYDGAKFCPECGLPLGLVPPQTQRRKVFEGDIRECPNCGTPLNAFDLVCPTCGHEIRNREVSTAVQRFAKEIAELEAERDSPIILTPEGTADGKSSKNARRKAREQIDRKIASYIQNFPIPNTKEDLFEFLILSSSNISEDHYSDRISKGQKTISDAWKSKFEQAYQKAKVSFGKTPEFEKIDAMYQAKQKSEKQKKKVEEREKRKAKRHKTIGEILSWAGLILLPVVLWIFVFHMDDIDGKKISEENLRLGAIVDEIYECIGNENYTMARTKVSGLVFSVTASTNNGKEAAEKAAEEWEKTRKEMYAIIDRAEGIEPGAVPDIQDVAGTNYDTSIVEDEPEEEKNEGFFSSVVNGVKSVFG